MEEQEDISQKSNNKKIIKIKPLSKSGICKNKNCKGCGNLQQKIGNLALETKEFEELLDTLKTHLCPSIFNDLNILNFK